MKSHSKPEEPEEPAPKVNEIIEPKKEPTTLWKKIEQELKGDYARGYALAIHLNIVRYMNRTEDTQHDAIHYEWDRSIEDDGNTSPDEWSDYLVCTDEEANSLTAEYIADSLWAFRADFLAEQTGVDFAVFEGLCSQCESGNEAVLSLIEATCGLDYFVESAISADGRGQFLGQYDSEEHEVVVGDTPNGYFFIYRVN
jgi:hypothetical protein